MTGVPSCLSSSDPPLVCDAHPVVAHVSVHSFPHEVPTWMDRRTGCSQRGAIPNNSAVNVLVHVFWWIVYACLYDFFVPFKNLFVKVQL